MAPVTAQDHPARLERLGRYRIVRPLSKGGMALVYEARRQSLAGVSPRVAIKLILPQHAGSDTFQELFINEARLGASLHHQNLVQIQDFDRDGEHFFLVMEYIEGVTLRRIISLCHRNGVAVPMGVVAELGRQACDGLHYAHGASDEHGRHLGLVHRDMKPSNLILNPQGVVKILDFGISKGRLLQERKGAVKGTWGYMAPEQAVGDEVGPPADVFGLATVLYELATQRPLFKGKKPAEIKRLLADDHAARMAALLDPTYGPLISVLVRALQRDPAARYGTAADFGRALSALLPDPITARDEVTRFYETIAALHAGRTVATAAPISPSVPASIGASMAAASHGAPVSTEGARGVTIIAGVTLAVVVVLGLVVGGVVLLLAPWSQPEPTVDAPSMADVIDLSEPPPTPTPVVAPESEPEPPRRAVPARAVPARSVTVPEPEPEPEPALPVVDEPVTVRVVRRPEPDPEPEVIVRVPAVSRPVDEPEPEPAVVVATGVLTISATEAAEVYIDGRYVRATPLVRREISAGEHIITIVASDGRRKAFALDVEAGTEVRRVWDFDRGSWR